MSRGAENDVLEGIERFLVESPEMKLAIEFNPTLLQDASTDPVQFLAGLGSRGFQVHCINEKQGPLAITKSEWPSVIEKLLKNEGSVNLLCIRQ